MLGIVDPICGQKGTFVAAGNVSELLLLPPKSSSSSHVSNFLTRRRRRRRRHVHLLLLHKLFPSFPTVFFSSSQLYYNLHLHSFVSTSYSSPTNLMIRVMERFLTQTNLIPTFGKEKWEKMENYGRKRRGKFPFDVELNFLWCDCCLLALLLLRRQTTVELALNHEKSVIRSRGHYFLGQNVSKVQ